MTQPVATPPDGSDVGRAIRWHRQRAEMTQQEAAVVLNTTQSRLSKIETGVLLLGIDELRSATVPQPVSDGVNQLMTSLELAYGALDFIVDPEECWYFLEINPNGQWGWIELATGLPIAHAIADLLEGRTP